jgi:hypothetical protein
MTDQVITDAKLLSGDTDVQDVRLTIVREANGKLLLSTHWAGNSSERRRYSPSFNVGPPYGWLLDRSQG